MRWAERGLSPVKVSLLAIVLLIVGSYFIFTKQLPLAHHYTIRAVVPNSNLLAPTSPVRIGGVDVGKVTSTGRYRNTNLAVVTMQIDNTSQTIHSDATIAIRPRLFLEGNFYVQLSPGTPDAPALADGGTIPADHVSDPVQIDQVLDALPADTRRQLQEALQGFGQAIGAQPTATQDAHLVPAVRGLTGGEAINRTFATSASSLRDSAIVSEGLTGPGGKQLSQVISGLGHASAGLAEDDAALTALVSDFDQTMRATAAQQQGLRQTVSLLGPTAHDANQAFSALDAAFPSTEQFSNALAPGISELPATIDAADPWLAQAGPLLSNSELRGLLRDLQPASSGLAAVTHDELQFLPKIDAFDRCITNVFLPTGNIAVNYGTLSTGVPN
jgi:phospholipid/cholesterol/gamma-HCH transport system substrate-binding protein